MTRISRRARRITALALAGGMAATALTLTPAHAADPVPQPGKVPHVELGRQNVRVGTLEFSSSFPQQVQAGNDWVTTVKVCNRGTSPVPVGPDTFSYTNADYQTKLYEPTNGQLSSELKNTVVAAGKCNGGRLLNKGVAPDQLAFHDLRNDSRIDILPATEWDAIHKVARPVSVGAYKRYGDVAGDSSSDVFGLVGSRINLYRTYPGPVSRCSAISAPPVRTTGWARPPMLTSTVTATSFCVMRAAACTCSAS